MLNFNIFFSFTFQNSKKSFFVWTVAGKKKSLVEKNRKCRRSGIINIIFSYLVASVMVQCNNLKMTLNGMKSRIPHICSTSIPLVPPFCYTSSHFQDICHLKFPICHSVKFHYLFNFSKFQEDSPVDYHRAIPKRNLAVTES